MSVQTQQTQSNISNYLKQKKINKANIVPYLNPVYPSEISHSLELELGSALFTNFPWESKKFLILISI